MATAPSSRPSYHLRLADGTSADALGRTVEVDATGVALLLDLPAGAVPSDAALTLAPAGAASATIANGEAATGWTVVGWDRPRPLSAIALPDALARKPARLSSWSGGGWIPLFPFVGIALGARRALPEVVTSRLMVEFGTLKDGIWSADETAAIAAGAVTVTVARHPSGLTLAVAGGPRALTAAGPAPITFSTDLPALVRVARSAWPEAPVEIRLSAALPGALTVQAFRIAFEPVRVDRRIDRLAGHGPAAVLALDDDGRGTATVALKPGSRIRRLACRVEARSGMEQPLPLPDAGPRGTAAFCSPRVQWAQRLPAFAGAEAISSIDLWLRPSVPADDGAVEGTVALHPDQGGRPAPAPFPDAAQPFRLVRVDDSGKGPAPEAEAPFLTCRLDVPLRPPGAWWVVVTVERGEALWRFAGAGQPGFRRLDGGIWQEARDHGLAVRPLLARPAPPVPTVAVALDGDAVVLRPEAGNWFTAAADDIVRLNAELAGGGGRSGGLTIAFTAGARGEVSILRFDLLVAEPEASDDADILPERP